MYSIKDNDLWRYAILWLGEISAAGRRELADTQSSRHNNIDKAYQQHWKAIYKMVVGKTNKGGNILSIIYKIPNNQDKTILTTGYGH